MVEMGTWRPGWGSRCVASQAYAAATAASLAIRRVEVVWWLFWLLIDALRLSSLSRLNCWYEASHQPQPTQPTQQGVVSTSIMWLLEGGLKWLQTEKLCFYISTTSSHMHGVTSSTILYLNTPPPAWRLPPITTLKEQSMTAISLAARTDPNVQ